MRNRKLLSHAIISAAMALMILAGGAFAQSSDTGTLTVNVWPAECSPTEPMSVAITTTGALTVQNGATSSDTNQPVLQLNVQNAGCNQWYIGSGLTNFALTSDTTTTFSATTLSLHKVASTTSDPNPATSLPDWALDLDTGIPTMPNTVTYNQNSNPATASGGFDLLTASTSATFASPGDYTASYGMSLAGLPDDLPPGNYTSTMTITVHGND